MRQRQARRTPQHAASEIIALAALTLLLPLLGLGSVVAVQFGQPSSTFSKKLARLGAVTLIERVDTDATGPRAHAGGTSMPDRSEERGGPGGDQEANEPEAVRSPRSKIELVD